jgi:hypothetical protein
MAALLRSRYSCDTAIWNVCAKPVDTTYVETRLSPVEYDHELGEAAHGQGSPGRRGS